MLLLENVKGLLSSDRGQTFQIILQELGRIGYWAEWQIFNSKYHGVPQNRERVFIIGHLRNGRPSPIFPIAEYGGSPSQELRKIGNIAETEHDSIWGRVYNTDGIAMNVTAEGGGVGAKTGLYAFPVLTPDRAEKRQHGRRFKESGDPSFTLTGQDIHGVAISFTNPHHADEERKLNFSNISRAVKPPYGNQQPLVLRQIRSDEAKEIRSKNIEAGFDTTPWDKMEIAPREDELSGSLTGATKDNWLQENMRIRRLTPCECERLQGFPDGWTTHGICEKGDIVWTGKYRTRVEIDEDGEEVTRYRPIMTKAKADGIYSISDNQRYRALGNAVTVNVVEFLGERINTHVFVR